MRYLRSPAKLVGPLSWSPDGKWLASMGSDGHIRVWGRDDVWPLAASEEPMGGYRMAFAADSRTLVTWNQLDILEWQFDPDAPSPSWLIPQEGGFTLTSVFTQDDPYFFAFGGEYVAARDILLIPSLRAIYRYERATGRCETLPLRSERYHLTSLAAHPDGDRIATSEVDIPDFDSDLGLISFLAGPQLRIWNTARGTTSTNDDASIEPLHGVDTFIVQLQFSLDGTRLLIAGSQGWEVRAAPDWERICHVVWEGRHLLIGWAISPDGRTVLTSTDDRQVIAHDADTGEERGRFSFNVGRVSNLSFAPDGLTAAASGGTKRIVMWDVE